MSEIYTSETSAAMQRDIKAWQQQKDAARDILNGVLSDLLDEGLSTVQLGHLLTGLARYGFRHRDGRWFGWESHGYSQKLVVKEDVPVLDQEHDA